MISGYFVPRSVSEFSEISSLAVILLQATSITPNM